MKRVAYIAHPDCLLHDCAGHPENAGRLRAIESALETAGLLGRMQRLQPRPATVDEVCLVHDHDYVKAIANLKPGGVRLLDPDTYINQYSARAAFLAFGAGILAVEKIKHGDIDRAFCSVRPPGHHALRDRSMGFCLFNNIAGAARFAQRFLDYERIAIIDFDVHHGNGTQDTFAGDPTVHFASLHQWPYYPGTGGSHEQGTGKGRGTTMNFPLDAGTDGHTVLTKLNTDWLPAMEKFQPQLILISAGFDAHKDDPLASLRLEDNDYFRITKLIGGVAERHCAGKAVSFLEGGYELDALGRSACQHVKGLFDDE